MSRFLKGFVILAGLLIVVTAGIKFVQDSFRLGRWKGDSELLSTLDRTGDSSKVFLKVDRRDFVRPPYPEAGDTIVALNGKSAKPETLFSELNGQPGGSEVAIEYENASTSGTLDTTVVTSHARGAVHLCLPHGKQFRGEDAGRLPALLSEGKLCLGWC